MYGTVPIFQNFNWRSLRQKISQIITINSINSVIYPIKWGLRGNNVLRDSVSSVLSK